VRSSHLLLGAQAGKFDLIVIHLCMCDHQMANNCSREFVQQVKSLVKEKVFCTLWATQLAIALTISKYFFFEHLLNKDEKGLVEVLKGEKLCQMMDKFMTMFSPNVRNLVASLKHWSCNKGYISSIFILRKIMVMITFKIIVF
jgi:hypothetical protein